MINIVNADNLVYEDIFSNNEYEASEASYRPYSAAGDKV